MSDHRSPASIEEMKKWMKNIDDYNKNEYGEESPYEIRGFNNNDEGFIFAVLKKKTT
jgi:hypothetical protein